MTSALGLSIRNYPARWGFLLNGVVCTLIGLIITLADDGDDLLVNLVVSYSIGFCIHSSIYLGFRLFSPRVPSLLIVTAGMVLGLVVGLMVASTVLLGEPMYFLRDDYSALLLGVVFGVIGTAAFHVLGDLWDVRARLERAERDALAGDKALAEAELRVLQAQMEPHFLFNTLANVISLIHDEPQRAARLLEELTALLRATLARSRAPWVTLGEELEVVRRYLEVQALRMDGRMQYELDVEPGLTDCALPPLLLQPLVENAVLHGIEPSVQGGRIRVQARREGGCVCVRVSDDGVGIDAGGSGAGFGTGLANVRERLTTLFGSAASLALQESEDGGVSVELRIPERDAEPARSAPPAVTSAAARA